MNEEKPRYDDASYLKWINDKLWDSESKEPYLLQIRNTLFAIKKQNEFDIKMKHGFELVKNEETGKYEWKKVKK